MLRERHDYTSIGSIKSGCVPMKKYVYGFLSGLIILPIIEALLDVAYQWIEVLKIKPTKIINQWNNEILKSNSDGDEISAIGFEIPSEELNDEYDD